MKLLEKNMGNASGHGMEKKSIYNLKNTGGESKYVKWDCIKIKTLLHCNEEDQEHEEPTAELGMIRANLPFG